MNLIGGVPSQKAFDNADKVLTSRAFAGKVTLPIRCTGQKEAAG